MHGASVDENALIEALKIEHIFAAGMHAHPEFCKMKNVTLTATMWGMLELVRESGYKKLLRPFC